VLVIFRSDGSADHVGAPVNDDHDVIDVSAAEPNRPQLRTTQMRNGNERCT
jgi:hypothetical protein